MDWDKTPEGENPMLSVLDIINKEYNIYTEKFSTTQLYLALFSVCCQYMVDVNIYLL